MAQASAKILVVANRTAESDELLNALKQRAGKGPAAFTLLVPATPRGVSWAMDMYSGRPEAEAHMRGAVDRIRASGLEVARAMIGDPDPVAAVEDALNFERFDEVIVSTLPRHLSKWLHLDLPRRIAHATGVGVTHVEAHETQPALR